MLYPLLPRFKDGGETDALFIHNLLESELYIQVGRYKKK